MCSRLGLNYRCQSGKCTQGMLSKPVVPPPAASVKTLMPTRPTKGVTGNPITGRAFLGMKSAGMGSGLPSCFDSDGRNYNTTGNVTGYMRNGQKYLYWDTCKADNLVGEWICNRNAPQIESFNCKNYGEICIAGHCQRR